jgi:hypothetical protein
MIEIFALSVPSKIAVKASLFSGYLSFKKSSPPSYSPITTCGNKAPLMKSSFILFLTLLATNDLLITPLCSSIFPFQLNDEKTKCLRNEKHSGDVIIFKSYNSSPNHKVKIWEPGCPTHTK